MSEAEEMTPKPCSYVFAFRKGSSDCDPARKDLLGGKGSSLAAMCRAGFPVPPGFTISAECCAHVERTGGEWPEGLKGEVRAAAARLEETTGRTFGRGRRSLLVAVRSGAAVSMPGMMDTILNCGLNPSLIETSGSPARLWADYADHIRIFARSVAGLELEPEGGADPESLARGYLRRYREETGREFPLDPWEALFQSIAAVFASWNSDRAVAYRRHFAGFASAHHDIRGLVGTAVNVQAMFPSQRSGVLFTANPNDPRAGEMVIEASWGLGEVVVSGSVTPDIYVVDAETLGLKSVTPGDRPGDRPALSEEEVRRVAELGRKVEGRFGAPSDIEWGIADGELVLLQTRPIRGIDVLLEAEACRTGEIERLRAEAAGSHVVWVVHNLSETLPAPTPLTWDIIRHFMSGEGGFGLMYRDFGYRPSARVREEGFLALICGRIYVDPRGAAGLFWDRMPFEYDPGKILADPQAMERPPSKLNLDEADPLFFLRLPKLVWAMLRCARKMRRIRSCVKQRFEREVLPPYLDFVREARTRDLKEMTTGELLAELSRRRRIVLDEFGKESLKPGFFGGLAQGELEALLVQLMGEEKGGNLTRTLTAGLEGDTTVEQNILLYKVAGGEAAMDEFLEKFGHRAPNEMELSEPRWREDPSYLERMVKGLRKPNAVSPEARHAGRVAARLRAEAELPERLAERGGSSLRERIEETLKETQELLPYREAGKHYLMMGYETIRAVLVELARRAGLGRDLFFLHLDELERLERDMTSAREDRDAELSKLVASRKLRWESSRRLVLPGVIDSQDLDRLGLPGEPETAEGRTRFDARPVASGAATGPARVVFDPREAGDLGSDYVLVCPSTDPGWTPLFVNAKGLVVERGGVLSHGAIVARDFGIPAVVCENATRKIPDGARVEIDGNRGAITLLD